MGRFQEQRLSNKTGHATTRLNDKVRAARVELWCMWWAMGKRNEMS